MSFFLQKHKIVGSPPQLLRFFSLLGSLKFGVTCWGPTFSHLFLSVLFIAKSTSIYLGKERPLKRKRFGCCRRGGAAKPPHLVRVDSPCRGVPQRCRNLADDRRACSNVRPPCGPTSKPANSVGSSAAMWLQAETSQVNDSTPCHSPSADFLAAYHPPTPGPIHSCRIVSGK